MPRYSPEAVTTVVAAARAAQIPVGSLISDPARIASMRDYGMDFLALGSDALALRKGLADQVNHVRQSDTSS
jgi:2-keto-3-deoxy-L-rhamnonate aldolase RhmA